jgi:archaellin
MKRYYYDGYDLDKKYATLWNGFLEYNSNNIEYTKDRGDNTNRELDDLVTNICNINFYIYILNSKIYISLCQDTKYYYYDFEKDIKKVIGEIEDKFKVKIDYGEFNATELKHHGNQYKYTITKDKTSKIILKKKILNWDNFESKSKKIKKNKDDINKDIENLKII